MRRFIVLLVVASVSLLCLAVLFAPRHSVHSDSLMGQPLSGHPAPAFSLMADHGPVRLVKFRGTTVILTFMEANCTEVCPRLADKLRRVYMDLRARTPVTLIAVSADPEGDTSDAIREFSVKHRLLGRWYFLRGTRAILEHVWRGYGVDGSRPGEPVALRNDHVIGTYVIDRQGRERDLFVGDLDAAALDHDVRFLTGISTPARAIAASVGVAVGALAPDFALRTATGHRLTLDSLRGHPVLLDFYASWCEPCQSEAPLLARYATKWKRSGIQVLGVDQQEDPRAVRAFAARYHLPYVSVIDTDGSVFARYNVSGLPTAYAIDTRGKVVWSHLGQLDKHVLQLMAQSTVHA